ncbi:MAG TPA: peptidoglycan DD-metalloendopeptidase family protein [Hyphomicrobium sp.]
MMRFMRFSRQGTSLAKPAGRAAAILFAGLAGGCSAQISGFDFPGFALNDDPKPQQTASAAGRGNPSYLGNDGYGSGGGDNAPRTYRENGVSSQSLPDASPPSSYASSDRRYDSGPSNTNANNGRYDSTANTTYSTDRRYATAPTTTNSTNRYDPQPQPSLSNPGDQVEVQLGDTLYGLSRRHRVSVAELMQVNSLTNPNLQPGQKLYLPQGYAANRSQPAPVQTASVQAPPASVPGDLDAKYRASYTMRQGDSLYGISRSYGVSVAELQQANGITDARGVKAGAVLRVPGDIPGQPLQQVAVNPPPTQPQYQQPPQSSPSYQNSSAQQPTILNGPNNGAASSNSQYTQVATRNVNGAATGPIMPPAQPQQTAARGNDKLRWPVSGRIINGFGQRTDGTHNDGINLSVPLGTSVHAAESGTVAYAGSELKGYGNLILLRHDNGWVTAYAHNDQLTVKRGDKVQRGQVIATAGRSGSVDQPQVHFELRQGSKPVDPVPFLERL